jgi:predicted DNA-binding transcriptional regulator AlpA
MSFSGPTLGNGSKCGIEPLLKLDDLPEILGVCRRTVERMRSGGRFPKPDLTLGRMPRWKPSTIRTWIDRGR